jgi:hypothetical protein
VLENVGKLVFIAHWLGTFPMNVWKYLRMWILPGVLIGCAYVLRIQESVIAMLLMAGCAFIVRLVLEIKNENLLGILKQRHDYHGK